ncbi:MAG: hypothetical protein BWY58_00166 [Chloroflexi bacterium ADurb.Bin344]|nr:MAG: hypothetical protein BWY58_00166 [Chloroflexi bacterium ADurb.Bin344]
MAKVTRIAAKTFGMAGVVGAGSAPEVSRIGDIAKRALNDCQRLISRPQQISCATSTSRILQCVTGPALGRVHANRHDIVGHATADKADAGLHRFGAGFAGKFKIRSQNGNIRTDGFRHHRTARFDRIRMRLRTDPYCP